MHENYNHEVDIELSQWDIDDLADVQYLVQPPGDPHKYRFFSGQGNTFEQAPHTYKFDWRPAEIEWNSDAGGGQHTFIYKTQDALDAGQPDYTQCMPADVEVRMNLWHLYGYTAPKGLSDIHMVEVVIDDFKFTPNGLTALPEGGTCSKDCHCDRSSLCVANKCTFVGEGINDSNPGGVPYQPAAASTYFDGEPPVLSETTSGISDQSQSIEKEQSASKESDKGGMTKAGKAFLTLFFLLGAAAAAFLFTKMKRDEKDRWRIVLFKEGGPPKKVEVECWEEDTEQASCFEMRLRERSIRTLQSLCSGGASVKS